MRRSTARDVPLATQIADVAGLEPTAVCCATLLAIEDAGNHGVGVMARQAANQRDRVLGGADGGGP